MATYVNNPQPAASNNGTGFLLGVIVLIIAAVLFFMYGLPLLRGNLGGGTSVNLPSQVNVHTTK